MIDRNDTAFAVGNGQANDAPISTIATTLNCMHDKQIFIIKGDSSMPVKKYRVRRLTPTECARLQGFPDYWGHPDPKETMTQEETDFWNAVRQTRAAMDGKETKPLSPEAAVKWYNKLHTDSSEYRMWGNGVALPNVSFVMSRIAKALNGEQL